MATVADIEAPLVPESTLTPHHRSVLTLWSINGHRVATFPSVDRYVQLLVAPGSRPKGSAP